MIISVVATMSETGVIMRGGGLALSLPADLARFRRLTMGRTVVVGARAYRSMGSELPGRKCIVLPDGEADSERLSTLLHNAIEMAEGDEELFVCGSADLYREAVAISQKLYLTVVHGDLPGDAFFPHVPDSFREVAREEKRECEPALTFLVYQRSGPDQGVTEATLRYKGLDAMRRHLYFLARRCFEQAGDSPENRSDLAWCLAKSGNVEPALQMAEHVVEGHPDNPRFFLTLGRIQMLAGIKDKGLATLRRGLQLGGGDELLAELARCGTRRSPLFPSLPRGHFLNRYLGLWLSRLGLRKS